MSNQSSTIKIIGFSVSLTLFFVLLYVLTYTPFPHSRFISYELIPTDQPDQLGSSMSRFLWNYRGLDLVMQTLILFATAISCMALLREEKH